MVESGVMLTVEIPTKEYRNLLVIEERYRLLLRALLDHARLNLYHDGLGLSDDIGVMKLLKTIDPETYETRFIELKKEEAEDV